MRNLFYGLWITLLWCACQSGKEKVEHISLQTRVLADSLYTKMPGGLFLCGPYLIWYDAFTQDTFLCVMDSVKGKMLGKMGKLGRGPEEFVSPSIGNAYGNKVVVYDQNLPKVAFYSADSLLMGRNPVQMLPDRGLAKNHCTYFAEIDSAVYAGVFPGDVQLLQVWTPDGRSFPFGKLPLLDSIANGYNVFQGMLQYNPEKKCLLYANYRFPYMALYQRQADDSFVLAKERTEKFAHTIKKQKLRLGKEVEGFRVCMTKNYIVVRTKESQGDTKPTSGVLDMSRMPRKLYLYDYDLNLKKVLDLDMQVIYMAGTLASDKFYIVGIKDSYCIAECEIPDEEGRS